eukprot:495267_1
MCYDNCKSAAVSIAGKKASSIHQNNEDHYQLLDNLIEDLEHDLAISPLTAIYVVCDGFGGDKCAEFVSTKLPGLIKECPHFESLDVAADEALLLSVLNAIEQVETLFVKTHDSADDSGCCLAVCIIRGELICVAWVGTCQLAVVPSTGGMTFVTEPHQPLANQSEGDRIRSTHGKNWKGEISDDGKVMGMLGWTRAIGGMSFKEKFPGLILSTPQVSIFQFCPETHGKNPVILLSTNNLFDCVSEDTIVNIASSAGDDYDSLQTAAIRLARTIQKESNRNIESESDLVLPPDDVTVVICKPSLCVPQYESKNPMF